jgi:hypothetical protein
MLPCFSAATSDISCCLVPPLQCSPISMLHPTLPALVVVVIHVSSPSCISTSCSPQRMAYLATAPSVSHLMRIEWSSHCSPLLHSSFSDSSTLTALTISSLFTHSPHVPLHPLLPRIPIHLPCSPLLCSSSFQETLSFSVIRRRSEGPAASEKDYTPGSPW